MGSVLSIAAVLFVVFGLDAVRRVVLPKDTGGPDASTPMAERRERLERLNGLVQSETRR
jgi:hypothetical protein